MQILNNDKMFENRFILEEIGILASWKYYRKDLPTETETCFDPKIKFVHCIKNKLYLPVLIILKPIATIYAVIFVKRNCFSMEAENITNFL